MLVMPRHSRGDDEAARPAGLTATTEKQRSKSSDDPIPPPMPPALLKLVEKTLCMESTRHRAGGPTMLFTQTYISLEINNMIKE